MGANWESILGTSGAGIADAYDKEVSDVIYAEVDNTEDIRLPFEEF